MLLTVVLMVGCGTDPEGDWATPLHKALRGATRLRVRTGGTCHRTADAEKTLLDTRNASEVAGVIQRIRIDPKGSGFHCMCCGNPTLEFYRNNTLILSLGFHHGRSLRWPNGKWPGDGLLTKDSGNFLVKWLADHGVAGPQEELAEDLRLQKQSEESQKRWLSAMPASLKPFWSLARDPFDASRMREMHTALSQQFPDPRQQILALLRWFGSGQGPWSGYPSYESIAEELLLLYDTEVLVGAMREVELTEQHVEGAARLFGGWDFSQRRPNDLRLVPDKLKRQLLEHSLKSDDKDKKARATRAFAVANKN